MTIHVINLIVISTGSGWALSGLREETSHRRCRLTRATFNTACARVASCGGLTRLHTALQCAHRKSHCRPPHIIASTQLLCYYTATSAETRPSIVRTRSLFPFLVYTITNMPRVRVQQPDAAAVKENARAFALLHQLDPEESGIDSEVRGQQASPGSASIEPSLTRAFACTLQQCIVQSSVSTCDRSTFAGSRATACDGFLAVCHRPSRRLLFGAGQSIV
jgi:hypothetical protein